jgi:SAM-dependent methyltransferase
MLTETLEEIARVLAPGGVLVASEPANDHWLIRRIRRWQYARSAQQGDDEEEDGFTREELASGLAAAGLRLRTYQVFGYIAYPLMGNTDLLPLLARSRRAWLGRALVRLDTAVESVPVLRRMGFASIFTATRYTP